MSTDSVSLGKKALKRFKKDILGMSGLVVVVLALFVAVFAYPLMPDDTPSANDMSIELSAKKPGFTVDVLKLEKQAVRKKSWLSGFFSGTPKTYTEIPITDWRIDNEMLLYKPYVGENIVSEQEIGIMLSDISMSETVDENTIDSYISSKSFVLGTDKYGRDLLSRLLLGTRISISVGFVSVIISLLIGVALGAIAGYYKGWVDNAIMWLINVVWSIPTLLLVIAITLVLGKGFWQVFIAVGLTMWVEVARVVRGQVLSVREKEYIEAARALGYKSGRIIRKHILPNVMGPVIVISAANFASAILIESGLSFLGIGAQPPIPSWGGMIKDHYSYIILNKAYLAVFPGLAIMLLVLAFMLIGNALRDALDVKASD